MISLKSLQLKFKPFSEDVRKKLWRSVSIIFLTFFFLIGCDGGGQEKSRVGAPTPTPIPLVLEQDKIVLTVERGPILSQREVTGEVLPANQEQLFFRARGYVSRVAVKAGDLVEKGQVMAELQLEDLLDQLEQAQIDLTVAQDSAVNEQLQRNFDIQQAKTDVLTWENKVALARNQVDASAGGEKENAELELKIAESQLETAKAWLNLVENRKSSSLENDVRRKMLSVERLERLVSERQIIAPYDGVVLKSSLYEGSEVEAFAPAILIGDPQSLVIRIPFNTELSKILEADTRVFLVGKKHTPSQEGSSTEDGVLYPIQYISEILPVSDKKEPITVRGEDISLNFHYFAIPPGTPEDQLPLLRSVLLRVILGEKEDALLLNPAGIRGIDEFKYVIVLEEGYHRRVEVIQIGLKTADKWEISGDLEPGDQVLGP